MKDIICVSIDKEIIDYLRVRKGNVKISTIINNILDSYIENLENNHLELVKSLSVVTQ